MDRRAEILNGVFEKHKQANPAENWASWEQISNDGTAKITFDSMDQYASEMCLDLLEYMAKNHVQCWISDDDKYVFAHKGKWLSKEQLFENFL